MTTFFLRRRHFKMLSYDPTKVRALLFYLHKATEKVQKRELARKKVQVAIHKLKNISEEKIQKDIDALSDRIAEAMALEDQILAKQQGEAQIHSELLEKIDKLQAKLKRYIETAESREQRMKKLEEKIFKVTQPKKFQIVELKAGLSELESIYKEEKRSGEHRPEELLDIRNKITALKSRIRELEQDYL